MPEPNPEAGALAGGPDEASPAATAATPAGTPPGDGPLAAAADACAPPAPPPTLRARLGRAYDGAARGAAVAARGALRHGPAWCALALAPLAFVWPIAASRLRPALVDNSLGLAHRIWLLGFLTLWAALLGVAALVVARRHRADGPGAAARAVGDLRDRLLPLLVLPFVPPLVFSGLETGRPVFTLALCGCAAAATVLAVYRAPAAPRLAAAFGSGSALTRYVPLAILALLVAGYATVFSLLSVGQHHALATKVHDLAIYDNIFWQSAHGNPLGSSLVRGGNHVAAHFDPLLIVLSPLYLLAPRAETLLVLQSLWLASGAIPVFAIGRKHLGPWAGLALAAMWTLYPAVHGANLYDFHSLTLIAPLVPWALHLADRGHLRRYAVVVALLLLAREDVSLLVGGLGLHFLFAGRARLGLGTLLAAAVWLAFAKLVVMPDPGLLMNDSPESYSFAYYYRDLIPKGLGLFGIVSTLPANPLYTLGTLLKDEKVLFFVRLFLPLLFLPFLAARGRIVLAYGLAFCLLASKAAVTSLYFQYAVLIFPAAFALVPPALARIRDGYLADRLHLDGPRLARGLLAGAVVATALVSLAYGALLPNTAFRAGPEKLVRETTPELQARYRAVRKAVALIPPEASVSASDHLAPHVSNRREAYGFPGPKADYVFVDLRDPKARREVQSLRAAGTVESLLEEEDVALLRRRDVPEPPAPTLDERPSPVQPNPRTPGAKPVRIDGNPPAPDGGEVLPPGHDEGDGL